MHRAGKILYRIIELSLRPRLVQQLRGLHELLLEASWKSRKWLVC